MQYCNGRNRIFVYAPCAPFRKRHSISIAPIYASFLILVFLSAFIFHEQSCAFVVEMLREYGSFDDGWSLPARDRDARVFPVPLLLVLSPLMVSSQPQHVARYWCNIRQQFHIPIHLTLEQSPIASLLAIIKLRHLNDGDKRLVAKDLR